MMKRWLKILLISLLAIALAAAFIVIGSYWTRFATIATLKEAVPESFYTLDFKADYKLDELLSRNLKTDQDFVDEALDIMYPMLNIKMEAPPLMCSVFAAETADGEHIFGRNFDLNQIHCMLIRTSPKDGYRSIAALMPEIIDIKSYPIEGLVDKMKLLISPYVITDGINEKGVGAAVLALGGEAAYQDTGKLPITTNLALRLILDKAATTDEAVALLRQYDMHASGGYNYHFFVTDRTGNSVVIEYYNDEMTVHKSDVCTNFYLREDAPKFQDKSSYERFDIVRKALDDCDGIVDEKSAMDILEAAHSYKKDEQGIKSTQWSEVFNLNKGTLGICIDMDYDHVYEFSTGDFK